MTNPEDYQYEIQAWPDLTRAIDQGLGVFPTTISILRQIEGAGRTGPKLLELIEKRLNDLGVGHLPTELPTRADERVVLYRKGTEFGEMVRAIEEGVAGSAGDALIRTARRVNRLADVGPVIPEVLRKAFSDVEDMLGGGEPGNR